MDDSENSKVPGLDGWEIIEFTSLGMNVALKFTNPIYVSSGKIRDKVIFEIKEPQIFQRSYRRMLTAQEKPETIKLTIDMKPQVADKKDFEEMTYYSNMSSSSVNISIVVGLVC